MAAITLMCLTLTLSLFPASLTGLSLFPANSFSLMKEEEEERAAALFVCRWCETNTGRARTPLRCGCPLEIMTILEALAQPDTASFGPLDQCDQEARFWLAPSWGIK